MGDDTSTLSFVQQLLEQGTETQNIQPKQPLQSLTIEELIKDLSGRIFNGQADEIYKYCRLFLKKKVWDSPISSLNRYDFDDDIDDLRAMLKVGIERCLPFCKNRDCCHKDNLQNNLIDFLKTLNDEIYYRRD